MTIVRCLLAGERMSFSGRVFRIDAMLLRTHPPAKPVPIFLAVIGPSGWESAMRIADGIATVWSPTLGEMRQRWMTERVLPTAMFLPFAQARVDFFTHPVRSCEELRQRVAQLDAWGYDEVIVAYADRTDLDVTADLLVGSGY